MTRGGTRRVLVNQRDNRLLNALVAYWPLDEASGNAADLHVNALTLTDTNSVTSNPGRVYALARQYTRANTEYHVRPGDDAVLSAGDVEFTIAAWLYLDSKSAEMVAFSKYNNATGEREYSLQYAPGTDRITCLFGNSTGSAVTTLAANSLGSPATATWYLVITWHDPSADAVYMQINDGAVDSAGHIGGVVDGTRPAAVGMRYFAGSPGVYWDGRVGPLAFWKSAVGGGGVLTPAQRTALYNGGRGLPYQSFTR